VDDDDLLARVQQRARLHGRNESRRAVCAVVEALAEFLSSRSFHLLAEQLPEEIRRRLVKPAAGLRPMTAPNCRSFLSRVGRRLLIDGPDAAFTARVVLEQLNATRRVITPAAFAHLVAPDLRPLLCARPAPQLLDEKSPAPRRVIRVPAAAPRPVLASPPTLARVAPSPATAARPAAAAIPNPATTTRPAAAAIPNPATPARPAAAAIPNPATPARPAAAAIPNPATTARPAAAAIPNPATPARPAAAARPALVPASSSVAGPGGTDRLTGHVVA
jgi:uncharacterized protein (DUF2267 family)